MKKEMLLSILVLLLFGGCSSEKFYSLKYDGSMQYYVKRISGTIEQERLLQKEKLKGIVAEEFEKTDRELSLYRKGSFYSDAQKRYNLLFSPAEE